MSILNACIHYFTEVSNANSGKYPTVHYLSSSLFDQLLFELKKYLHDNDQRFVGNNDVIYLYGVRVIRTGEP